MDTLPWYKSHVMVGALISLIAKVAVLSGLVTELSPDDQTILTNTIVLIASGIGDMWAMYGRVSQKQAPKITARKH